MLLSEPTETAISPCDPRKTEKTHPQVYHRRPLIVGSSVVYTLLSVHSPSIYRITFEGVSLRQSWSRTHDLSGQRDMDLPSLCCEGSGVMRLVATKARYKTRGLVMARPVFAIGNDMREE